MTRFSLILLLFLSLATPSLALDTTAEQAFAFDVETGTVLLNKNADQRTPTSSMSKVMTIYMVFDALEEGRITLQDTFQVSEKAWKKGGSKMFVPVGERVSVEDLIKGVIIQSGNDATIVLAEGLAGSEEAFAAEMTEVAVKELGMVNSNFVNASGWPDDDHYSTARDLSRLASAIITRFPQYYHYYAMKEFTFSGITQANRNPLLSKGLGADGIKTGHTEAAGYGLMASGERDNRRVIMVLNGMDSQKERSEESARLLGWLLSRFENIALFADQNILGDIPVFMGAVDSVPVRAASGIKLSVPRGAKDKITFALEYETPIPAPIKQGDEIGALRISIPDQDDRVIAVQAASDVEKAGWGRRVSEGFIHWIDRQF